MMKKIIVSLIHVVLHAETCTSYSSPCYPLLCGNVVQYEKGFIISRVESSLIKDEEGSHIQPHDQFTTATRACTKRIGLRRRNKMRMFYRFKLFIPSLESLTYHHHVDRKCNYSCYLQVTVATDIVKNSIYIRNNLSLFF